MKMDIQTFNDLAEKKMCGAFAYITGKIKIEGSIFALKNFENNVVCKYFPDRYSK
jgi:putative sterol carrier protein